MKTRVNVWLRVFLLSLSMFITNQLLATPAFPGAEGGGASALGGRGGDVYKVTSLNDDGTSGTLRYGIVNASDARTIIFNVGGTIQLNSSILVNGKSNITIAGQTAPGGGIAIGGLNITQSVMEFTNSNNVVIRYVRFRKGGDARLAQAGDCITVTSNCHDIIVDHCSISWATDENFSIWADNGVSKNITMQWCVNSEGQMTHSCGILTGSNTDSEGMTDISVHHNLFAHNYNRNPLVKVMSADIINNIIYNWGWWAVGIGGGVQVDIIGNKFKSGADSGYRRDILYQPYYAPDGPSRGPNRNPIIYFDDNMGSSGSGDWNSMLEMTALTSWGWPGSPPSVADVPAGYQSATRRSSAITADPVGNLENILLNCNGVGASQKLDRYGNWVENRDEVDVRVVNEYFAGVGNLIYSATIFPSLASGTANTDADSDGMPDAWEILYGVSDKNADADGDGYTNLEEFLNGTDPLRTFYFKFNEASGTTGYEADKKYTATLNGLSFTNNSVFGIAGTALQFDGTNDYVSVSPKPTYAGDFSVAAWIKFSTAPGLEGFGIISVTPDAGCLRMRVAIGTDAKLRYGLYNGSWAEKTAVGDALNDGKWHHVAVTFDRDSVAKSYIDGVLKDDTLSISTKTGMVVGTHYIGYDNGFTSSTNPVRSRYFNGCIDEVKEYNAVLTPAQIVALAKDIPVNFTFNENSGVYAYDSYGNFTAELKKGTNDPAFSFTSCSVPGKLGNALNFNSSTAVAQNVEIANPPIQVGDFTFAAWVKIPSQPVSGYAIISNTPVSSSDTRARLAVYTDGKLWYGLYNGSVWVKKQGGIGVNLCDNTWHHVAVTFNRTAGSMQGYVDGMPAGTTMSFTPSSYAAPVNGTHYIGYDNFISSSYMHGCIDGAREYNRILSADEINCLAGKP